MSDDLDQRTPDVPPSADAPDAQPPTTDPPDVAAQPPARHPWRLALIVLGVIAVLGISLAFQPVRTFAAQMLSIFRVQDIATISLTSEDLEQIGNALERGDAHVSLEELGDVWMDGKPGFGTEEATLTTLAAAQSAVNFPVLVPTGVEGTQSVAIQPGMSVKFRLHVDKVNALLRYYGAEKQFSKSVDNKTFEIKVSPTVYMAYGDEGLGFASTSDKPTGDGDDAVAVNPDSENQDVVIVQTRSPELVVPSGVNPLELREVILGLPFLPDNIRNQLSGVTDWQHTLLIPNVSGSAREITVAGNPGVVVVPPHDPGGPDEAKDNSFAMVMWHQDGVLRAVGASNEKESRAIAESMNR